MDASESGRAASEDERSENSELAAAGGGASRRRRREEADTAGDAAHKKPRGVCPHQRRRNQCKECGGASICQHQRRRSRCKECHEEADESMPAGLEELEGTSSKVARRADERGSDAVGAAFGAAGESAPLVMEIEPVSGCTGPPVGRRVKRKPNIIDRGASAASASGP